MPNAVALRHVAFEGLGTFEPVLRARGYDVKIIDACVDDIAGTAPPDLLVVLGGPIGAYEEATYPFLSDELKLIERQIARGAPILGICLGAQLMARALGARVYPGPAKEIGWSSITLTIDGATSPLAAYKDGAPVLHWHGDTFDLPASATRLASTEVTPNQAFSVGRTALGLQFHGECDGSDIERWLVGHAAELAGVRIDVPALRAQSHIDGPRAKAAGIAMLSSWLDQLPKESS